MKIQAASVNTGSGLKDSTLKSDDFFNVEQEPLITFHGCVANFAQEVVQGQLPLSVEG